MNHVMLADDICLMAPSHAALQELIDICYDFSVQNDLSFGRFARLFVNRALYILFLYKIF